MFLALAGPSQPVAKPRPNTLLLGDLGDGQTLWLALDSVKKGVGPVRQGWSIINYAAPQQAHGVVFSSDASKFYVNCESGDVDLVNAIKFSDPMGGGRNVFQVNSEPTPVPSAREYHPAHAGTAEQVVAAAICKQKIGR